MKRSQPESVGGMEETKPRTATAGRRHRPSTKAADVETKTQRRERTAATRVATAKKNSAKRKPSVTGKVDSVREDKAENPEEMVTNARPQNLHAEKKGGHNKGKATHELEASSRTARPSRKSTRGGANRIKPDSQLQRRTTREVRSPKNRQSMRGG